MEQDTKLSLSAGDVNLILHSLEYFIDLSKEENDGEEPPYLCALERRLAEIYREDRLYTLIVTAKNATEQ